MRTSALSILVVDDDPDYVFSTTTLLRYSGDEAGVARSGAVALRQAAEQAPDVVLLDLAMPGMDGYELAKRLKDACTGKPPFVVAVSDYGRAEDRLRSWGAGIDLHLVKPVAPIALFRVLDQFEVAAGISDHLDG